jgi:hypothetical protein
MKEIQLGKITEKRLVFLFPVGSIYCLLRYVDTKHGKPMTCEPQRIGAGSTSHF